MKRLLAFLVAGTTLVVGLAVPSHAETFETIADVYRSAASSMPTSGSVVRDLKDSVSVTTPFPPTRYELRRNGATVATGTTDRSNMSWIEFIPNDESRYAGSWAFTVRVPLASRYVPGELIEITVLDTAGNRTTVEAKPSSSAGAFARVQFNRNTDSLTSTARRVLDSPADVAVRSGTIRLAIRAYRDARERPELAIARTEAIRAHLAARRPALVLGLDPVTMAMSDKALTRNRVAVILAFLP
jgi:hypothetical protein